MWRGQFEWGGKTSVIVCFNNFNQTLFLLRVCLLCKLKVIVTDHVKSFGKLQVTTNESQLVAKEFGQSKVTEEPDYLQLNEIPRSFPPRITNHTRVHG